MTSAPLIPLEIQIPALVVLALFLGWVIRLVRLQALTLRDSLLWLVTTVAALVLTAFPELLGHLAGALGFKVPANAIFAVGLFYLAVNVLWNTIAGSANRAQVRRLNQECALLREEIDRLRARQSRAETGRRDPS